MQNPDNPREAAVLGQKYAYATASLILGLLCFVNLAGLEKAVVAIVFGVLALAQPHYFFHAQIAAFDAPITVMAVAVGY